MIKDRKKATLLLADGTIFNGFSMGCEGTTIGEIVFATGMTGYQETLTDPSYYGQMITQTFPLVGNYGTNDMDFESDKCYLQGYIVREWCEIPSNFRSKYTLNEFLKAQSVVGIYGIDTRSLTRRIRDNGVMNGMITTEENLDVEKVLEEIRAYKIIDAVKNLTCKEVKTEVVEDPKYHVVLMDFGAKRNIERHLLTRNCNVTTVPALMTADEIKALNPDGIMLSNGPGDPAENTEIIETIRSLIADKIPTFGICLGHQLVALANDAKTVKLKYGHRGANQPVIDVDKDKTYVTSQNHGYAVVGDSIPEEIGYVSHKNANDGTCEGVHYTNTPTFTVQFHPEACGGPTDTEYLFDEFVALMKAKKGGN